MAEKKNGHSDRAKERQDMQVRTLTGDIRDNILRMVRELPAHWHKMTGEAQQDVINNIERIADRVVNDTVDIVASRGCEHIMVTLGKVSIDKGAIKSEFTTPFSFEGVNALCSRQGRVVALVARDADYFKGEQARAEPDNVGDLAIPRGELQQEPQPQHN